MEQNDLTAFVGWQLDDLGVPYFVTGSVASSLYGDSRQTNDVDIVADLQFMHVTPFAKAFPPDDFYLSVDAIRSAIQHHSQFNIIDKESFLKVDIIIPQATAHAQQRMERRTLRPITPTVTVSLASPEDIIVSKLAFYEEGGSEKHLRDIAGILQAGRVTVDYEYVRRTCRAAGVEAAWDVVLARLEELRQ